MLTNYQTIARFKKMEFHFISASIETNPKLESTKSCMSYFDLMDDLGSKNSGCLIHFGDEDDCDPICKLITWNMVLKGGINAIQAWSQKHNF